MDAMSSGGKVNATYDLGVPNVLSEDQSGIADAVKMASEVDTVVLAVGTDLTWGREGQDAKNISFTDAQIVLIEKVSAVAKNPVVLVLFTANPLDISAQLSNANIGAILHVGQPSVTILGVEELMYVTFRYFPLSSYSHFLTSFLFRYGDVSPAGRTIQTFYPASYQDQISIFDFGMRPGTSPFARPDCTNSDDPSQCPRGTNPGRTYRFYTGKPVVPFGFGLSYTSFSYAVSTPTNVGKTSLEPLAYLIRDAESRGHPFVSATLESQHAENVNWKESVQYTVNVTNTGSVDADDVVLGFMTPPGAGENGVPLKTLFGFERVHVKAGETVRHYV